MNKHKPFRYKKVGKDKYEYDFMSWEEWENMMKDMKLNQLQKPVKTIELEEKQRLEKVSSKLYPVDQIMNILQDITTDYIQQVSLMSDEELNYDRSYWILHYGDGNGSYDENTYEVDIHTISILLEQVRRFGRIVYEKGEKSIKLD